MKRRAFIITAYVLVDKMNLSVQMHCVHCHAMPRMTVNKGTVMLFFRFRGKNLGLVEMNKKEFALATLKATSVASIQHMHWLICVQHVVTVKCSRH